MTLAQPATGRVADWQAVLDGLPVGVAVLSASSELICLHHNRRFVDITAPTRDPSSSGVGLPLRDMVPAPLNAELARSCDRARATGSTTSVGEVAALAGAEASPRYYGWTITPVATDGESHGELLVVVTDATEIVRARARIEKLSHLGQQILAGEAPETILADAVDLVAATVGVEYVGVFRLTPDLRHLTAVAGIGVTTGSSGTIPAVPGSLGGEALADPAPLVIPDVRDDRRFANPPAFAAERLISGIASIIQAPDAPYGLLVAFTRQRREFAAHEINAVQAVANFYSAALFRRHAENAIRSQALEIRDARDLLEAVLETVATGVIVHDTDGRPVYCNHAAARALGFRSVDRLIDLRLADMHALLQPLDETGVPMTIERLPTSRVFAGERMPESLMQIRHAQTGSPRWLIVKARPILADGGRVKFAVSLFEDITAQRRAEEELVRRAEQQAVIAELGQRALGGVDIDALMNHATRALAATLRVDYAAVFQLLPDRRRLVLRTGVGWRPGEAGAATVGAARRTQAGYALGRGEPVVVDDFGAGETPLRPSPLLRRHGVRSGVCASIGERERPFGVLCAHATTERRFSEDDVHFLQSVANVIGTAVARGTAEEALAEQTRLAEESRFEERLRLAREIHDGLAQELWLAKLKQGRLSERLDADGDLRELSDELGATLQRALDNTRQAVITLRASAGDGPFGESLRRYVEDTSHRLKVPTHYTAPRDLPDLPPRVAANVLRVVQEALNNVARHAAATEVRVSVAMQRDRLVVTVADDGRGFAATEISRDGFGIAGMRERARQVGGTLSLRPAPRGGTRVRLDVPLTGR